MSVSLQIPSAMSVDAVRGCPDNGQQESSKDCTYFTRTGCCSFGNDCKYRHDRSKILPLAGYTDNGYPIRPGCDVCTFYLSTGWCNHWFSCSKDHDITRLSPECRESLPPPTIMEQFHRFKYHSYTKEYKPLCSNHLPEAIRSKRWIVGNEYGQSSLPVSAQSRIMSSFKNGIPEEVKDRLQRFLPSDANLRNMQLMRGSMGGYLGGFPGNALVPRMSVPNQFGAALGTSAIARPPSVTNKIMTPVSATVVSQPAYAAAAAAGYQPSRIPAAYQLDPKPSLIQQSNTRQDRYYPMATQAAQSYPSYSAIYQQPYSMEMSTVSLAAPTPTPTSFPLAGSPTYSYLPQTTSQTLLPLQQGTGSPQGGYLPQTTSQTLLPLQQGTGSPQGGYVDLSPPSPPTTYAQTSYQQAQQQYPGYMYGSQGVAVYPVAQVMNYPQHGWSYGNADNNGGILEQVQEENMLSNQIYKGQKLGDERPNMLQENMEECLYNNESH